MTISAVLLAGGKSSRMGQDKATMLFRGGPLWKNQLEVLRGLQWKEVLVSAQKDPPWRPADIQFVGDEQPSRGPLSGIAAALSRMAADFLLVLAIDVPFMTDRYLRSMCARILPGQGVVPMIENRAEPLVAIYPRDAGDEFTRALSGTDFSLQPLVRKLIALEKLRSVDGLAEETSLFRNLNEPGDVLNGRGGGIGSA
jgi:molybdopterin-guanine dinucleotide biosynthesis protein A